MPKQYRTIEEVAGPLMMVKGVENVAFDELGEIELVNGETRRCRVLEINGDTAMVQLFESSTGINLFGAKFRIYSDKECTKPIYVIPTDVAGVYIVDSYGKPIEEVTGTGQEASRKLFANYLNEYLKDDKGNTMIQQVVDEEMIAKIVSRWTHIEISRLMSSERQKILPLLQMFPQKWKLQKKRPPPNRLWR